MTEVPVITEDRSVVRASPRPVRVPSLARRDLLVLAIFEAIAISLAFVLPYSAVSTGIVWGVYAAAAVALNVLTGVSGLPSIGNAAFLAIGAYAVVLVPFADHSLWSGLLAGGLAAAVIGAVAGMPALRLSGFYLAVSTLALQFIAQTAAEELQTRTNHIAGYAVRPATLLPGVAIRSQKGWYAASLLLLGFAMWLARRWTASYRGRSWLAIRENTSIALSAGVAVGRQKVVVFVLSSAVIGVSGAFLAFYDGTVDYQSFSLTLAIEFVAMVIIGGLGTLWGPLVGAGVVVFLPYLLQQTALSSSTGTGWLATNQFVLEYGLYGALVVIFLLLAPGGLVGSLRAVARRIVRAQRRYLSSGQVGS